MKKLKRSKRRFKTRIKQRKRLKKNPWTKSNPRKKGRLKDNHFGCSCPICKPWKFGFDTKLKPSDLKKIKD